MPWMTGRRFTKRFSRADRRRLKDVGYPVTAVYDANAAAASAVAQEVGARHCQQLAAVTEAADIVLTVVTDSESPKKRSPTNLDVSLLACVILPVRQEGAKRSRCTNSSLRRQPASG